MAVLPPRARGPLPKIAPLLVQALEEAGWRVDQTYWGGRDASERRVRKLFSRLIDLAAALGRLVASPGAILFVNSAHSWRGLVRDIPLVAGARCLRHGSVVLLHGSSPELACASPRSPFAYASRALARSADAILLLSTEELELWRTCAPAGRFFRVSNPFETTVGDVPRTGHRRPKILFVGRVLKEKGVFDLAEAFSRVRQSEDCELSIVGDGPDAAQLSGWIRDNGLSEHAHMHGYAEGPALARHYEDADIFALPSYWPEGFPTVLAEAMDAGLAVVTTRRRGMADHLTEGVNCFFVQPRDPDGLAQALTQLLREPDLRRSMGEANRLAAASFAPRVVVAGYLRALDDVEQALLDRQRIRRARTVSRRPSRARRSPARVGETPEGGSR